MSDLLAAALMYRTYLVAACRSRRQLAWLIELAHLLHLEDEDGQPRQARQVKREVKDFLTRLEQNIAQAPEHTLAAHHLIQTIRNRWWGLFTCYRVRELPATNNDHESFFNHLKQGQRRINGHKAVHEFIIRYGVYAAYIDPHETFDQLLGRLRQVSDVQFQTARQAWRENEAPLHKAHRFRYHRVQFLKDLETEWAKLTQ